METVYCPSVRVVIGLLLDFNFAHFAGFGWRNSSRCGQLTSHIYSGGSAWIHHGLWGVQHPSRRTTLLDAITSIPDLHVRIRPFLLFYPKLSIFAIAYHPFWVVFVFSVAPFLLIFDAPPLPPSPNKNMFIFARDYPKFGIWYHFPDFLCFTNRMVCPLSRILPSLRVQLIFYFSLAHPTNTFRRHWTHLFSAW